MDSQVILIQIKRLLTTKEELKAEEDNIIELQAFDSS